MPVTPDRTPGIETNTYDGVISTGVFVEGHVQMESLFELVRITKPGGYIVYTLYDPEYTLDYMRVHGEVIKLKKAQLISMKLQPYKREFTKNFEYVDCYIVIWKVL